MFDIRILKPDEIVIAGRFDASQVDIARAVLNQLTGSAIVDMKNLQYVSSAGLGILLAAEKRLNEGGHKLRLANMNSHLRDIFQMSRLDTVFEIVDTA
ncbi:MAG: STAS domain-containing protein [Nitrososphaera sp.]|nr:STAS domain-containing protein [Nitrososphaera sp.]MCI0706179.1 STAS domain-containing protein [Ignavibacteriota bacterium]